MGSLPPSFPNCPREPLSLFGEYRSVYIRSSTAPSSGYAQETAKSRPLWRARKTAQCRCYVLIKRRFPSYLRTGQRAALREHREHREHREQEALKHRRDETEAGSCSFFSDPPTQPRNKERNTRWPRSRSALAPRTAEAQRNPPSSLPPPTRPATARARAGDMTAE